MHKTGDRLKQVKSLKNAKGIQYILNSAYEILGNPMLIFNMEYELIAYSEGAVTDDPIWGEFMTHGRLCDETVAFFKSESFIDEVANSTIFDGITYLISDKLKYDRIFGQIYNKEHQPVADLVAVACDRPFEDDTPELIATICSVISKRLGKSKFYQDYGQAYQENIIKELLDGNKELHSSHVANIDKDLKANIFVAVADITQCDPACAKLMYFQDLFRRRRRSFKYAVYSNYIIILISSDSMTLCVKKDLNKLYSLFKQHNIYVGISSGFQNLYELQNYYNKALEALNCGLKSNVEQQIFLYNEMVEEDN